MFVLTISTAKPTNIKKEMANSSWIEAMYKELHQFDRLQVWEHIDKPFGKTLLAWKLLKFSSPMLHTNLSNLLDGRQNGFSKWSTKGGGTIDPIIFMIRYEDDILLVQIYVDDIIFRTSDPPIPMRCIDTRKSTYGGIQFLGDKLVSWMSKKQDCTAMSLAEAEYVALSTSCAQVIWMRTQLKDYGFNYNKIPLYCDSQLAIAISCNPVQHSRTKHIHTQYHFIKEHVKHGIIEMNFVRTEYQLADMFTKTLLEDRFQYLVRRICMRCFTLAELEVLANESA
nr:retrovirus-related Pol polyprotein from transposon TNT 1-94 [Tanacetum cinerariifolium]